MKPPFFFTNMFMFSNVVILEYILQDTVKFFHISEGLHIFP